MHAKEHLLSRALLFNVTKSILTYGKHHRHLSLLQEIREVSQLDDGGVEKVRLERGLKGGL